MKRLVVIIAAILAAAVAFLVWWSPIASSLPTYDRATVSILSDREGRVIELSLGDRERLHDLLSGVPRDRNPAKWQVFGAVRLFEAGREVAVIDVFSNSSGAGPMRIGKHYFLGYDQEQLREMLGLQERTGSSH